MKRLGVLALLCLACSPGPALNDGGQPPGPRLQSCTIELADESPAWVLEPGQRAQLRLSVRAVRSCSETLVQPDEVLLTLTDDDGQPLEFTSRWERRLEQVELWLDFTVPETRSVRASATIEPGFGIVRWLWPVERLGSLQWTETGRSADGFLESDAGRAWYSSRGVQFETPSGEFSAGLGVGVALSATALWALDPLTTTAWSASGVRLATSPTQRPTALGVVDGRLFLAEGIRLTALSPDGGRSEYRDPVEPDGVEALGGGDGRVRLCRRGRVDALVLPASWRRDMTPPVANSTPCMHSGDGMWLVEPGAVTLVRPDGGRDVARRPRGDPLSSNLLLPARAPVVPIGVSGQNAMVVWLAISGGDGGLEGRTIVLPPGTAPTGFDGRRLFIQDSARRLAWAEPE